MLRSSLLVLLVASPAFAQWELPKDFKAAKADDLKDAATTPPPDGATVLFDGKTADGWTRRNDPKKAIGWTLKDGVMEGVKGHGDVISKENFAGPFTLHLEFRVPYEPKNSGQGRGNSGVYLQGRYEIQILDSYGLKSGKNDCAAVYDIHPPKENACKAPTVWQSYDIDFTPPKFGPDGKKTEPGTVTVVHNGVKVHDGAKLTTDNSRAGLGGDPAKPGPILLQDHGHPVQFRNVWLVKK